MSGFILGGIYTIIIVGVSGVLGYILGSRKETKIINELKNVIKKSAPAPTSGPIKPYTKQERELEGKQYMANFIEKLHQ